MEGEKAFIGYAVAALFGGIVTYALKFLEPKAKLVFWFPHSFRYHITSQNVTIHTQSYLLQNMGYKQAKNIEIVHLKKPDFFKLSPSLLYTEKFTPDGEHVLCMDSLASKEFFALEILSYGTLPELQYIRYEDGQARQIQFDFKPSMEKWKITAIRLLILTGGITIIYSIIMAAMQLYDLAT